MMIRYIRHSGVFMLLLILFSLQSRASDIMGADITYRCLGNDSFEFTTIVYKDCNANWTIPANTYNLSVSAINCSYSQKTFYPQLVSCVDITPVCGGYCTKCNSTCNSNTSNGSCSFPYGIEKLTFKVIVYLGGTSCCNFHIGYIGNSTRNTATTTCCNSDLFYTYVELNRCLTPCNSSPIFTNDPVGIICSGQDFVFNNGALDSLDGDSISFELAPAMRGNNLQATYYGNYSPTRPLSFFGFPNTNAGLPAGFHLDPVTGDLAFRPTQANQIAVIVIKVTEWRRIGGALVKVGETRRDMQFIIIACPGNEVPTIAPPYTVNACSGQKICMDIVTNDSNTNDTVRISWNQGIRGATFTNNNGTVKHAQGEVCWTPTESDVSNIPYTFTITARDDACPITGQSVRSFSIYVRETPKVTISTQLLGCGKVALHYVPYKSYPGFVANWAIRDENQVIRYGSPNNQVYDTAFLPPGKYRATLSFRTSTPCIDLVSDSFEIVDFVQVQAPSDTFVCESGSIQLDAISSKGKAPYVHEWRVLTDSAEFVPFAVTEDVQVQPDTSKPYVIQISDAEGCFNWDTVRVAVKYPPPVDLGPDIRVCKGDISTLDGGNDSLTYSYFWITGDTSRLLDVSQELDYWVRVTDEFGCYNSDTLHHELADMNLYAGPDLRACEGDTIRIGGTGADLYQWYNLAGFKINPLPPAFASQDSFSYIVNQNRSFVLRGRKMFDTLLCVYLDTMAVSMDPAPYVQISPLGPYCPDDDPVNLVTAVQFPTAFNGDWYCTAKPAAVSNGLFYPNIAGTGTHSVTYEVSDALGCKNRRSIQILVRPAPGISLLDTFQVCANEKELALNTLKISPANYNGMQVNWYEANANMQVETKLDKSDPNNVLLKMGNTVAPGTYAIVLNLTNTSTGCRSWDTCVLVVKTIPQADAGTLASVCFNEGSINLNAASGANPAGGVWTSTATIQAPAVFLPSSLGELKRYSGDQVWFYYTRSLGACSNTDSVLLVVKPQPQLIFPTDSLCKNQNPVDLNSLVSPGGAGSSWTGASLSINGSQWDIGSLSRGWYTIQYAYTAANGCSNTISSDVFLEDMPSLTASIPDDICEGAVLNLASSYTNTPNVWWTTTGDGTFDGAIESRVDNPSYTPGSGDVSNGNVSIRVMSEQNSVCPEVMETKLVAVYPLPEPVISATPLEGCEPLEVLIQSSGQVPANSRYVWNFGEGPDQNGIDLNANLSHTYQNYGSYTIRLKVTTSPNDGNCSVDAAPVTIEVYPGPNALPDAEKWMTSVNFPGVQFFDRSTVPGNAYLTKWEWQFGDPNNGTSAQRDPYYEFPILNENDSVFYRVWLRVETNNGCWDTAGRNILIIPELSIFIPNAFTPNGQDAQINEKFIVVAGNYKSIKIQVFDRWGEEVYQSDDAKEGWDGTFRGEPVPQDVYVYLVEVVSIHEKVYRYSGTLTLLR